MDLLPVDIEKRWCEHRVQHRYAYYVKKAHGEIPLDFCFRVSVNPAMNSTAVFLCDDKGKILQDISEEQQELYKKYYSRAETWLDGRFAFFVNDDDEGDTAIWQVSSQRDYMWKYLSFQNRAPKLLLGFRETMKNVPDEGLREAFESVFKDHLDNMTVMLDGAKDTPSVPRNVGMSEIKGLFSELAGLVKLIGNEGDEIKILREDI